MMDLERHTAPSEGGSEDQTSARSSLRQRHAEQTRNVILGALTEQLAREGFSDFDIPSLARRAGVSVRTIYRYFQSRDVLLDALAQWINDQIAPVPRAVSVDDLAALPEALFPAFDQHEQILRAQSATDQGRALRAKGRRQHLAMYQEALSEVISQLPPDEARAAAAVITYLLGSQAWRTMKEEYGMDGEESGRAVAWAVRTLIDDLDRRSAAHAAERDASAKLLHEPVDSTSPRKESDERRS
jgi:AcrR family transcriptional regulator